MSRHNLFHTIEQLADAIHTCTDSKLYLPALMLIYAGIDICGWLSAVRPDQPPRDTFTAWVETYLFPSRRLPCTALELYAARCGLLHTYSADSRLAQQGTVRRIAYAWGNATEEDLQRSIELEGRQADMVAVHANDLICAFDTAILAFFREVIRDPLLGATFDAKAGTAFTSIPTELIHKHIEGHSHPNLPGA